jgi:histidinol-phosphate aminotransferase
MKPSHPAADPLVPARRGILEIPRYRAGAAPRPVHGVRSHKLSSNELALPPLPEVTAAITRAQPNRYPDVAAMPLREAVAAVFGIAPEAVLPGAGSLEVLSRILQAYAGVGADGVPDEVALPWRSFEAYPLAIQGVGAVPVPVPLSADGRHDLLRLHQAIGARTRAVVLCSPNNPTGPALTHTETAEFVRAVPGDVLVVIDEAYAEFVRGVDPLDAPALAATHRNVVVLRTLSKAHGLAALRVGYAIGHPDTLDPVWRVVLPFPVSAPAIDAAVVSLAALPRVLDRAARVVGERERLSALLADRGITHPDAQGNFVWLPLGDRTARFVDAASDVGIAVRAFPREGVRVSIGDREASDRLLAVVDAFD